MNLSRIVDTLRYITDAEFRWHVHEVVFCHLHGITDVFRKKCKHTAPNHPPKQTYNTLAECDKFVEEHAEDVASKGWRPPTAAYYCPSCGGWHIATTPPDPEGTKKWQEQDMQYYNAVGQKPQNYPEDGVMFKSYGNPGSQHDEKAYKNRQDFKAREKFKRDKDLEIYNLLKSRGEIKGFS